MQTIARELNNSETAFILSPTASDHDVWLRFFTPMVEVSICGHATIAAHVVRAIEHQMSSCIVLQKIGAGILPVEIIHTAGGYEIVMTQGAIEFSPPFETNIRDRIVTALHLTPSDLDDRCPMQIVSAGSGQVMIGIRQKATLNALMPNVTALLEISRQICCSGYFIFTLDSDVSDILTHGRMFSPLIGVPEDPVTGNSNGPLGAYLIHHGLVQHDQQQFHFKSQQGEAIGRTGIVDVTVEMKNGVPVRSKVGGRAVIVFQTEIEI